MVKNKDERSEVEEAVCAYNNQKRKGCRQKCDSQSYLREHALQRELTEKIQGALNRTNQPMKHPPILSFPGLMRGLNGCR